MTSFAPGTPKSVMDEFNKKFYGSNQSQVDESPPQAEPAKGGKPVSKPLPKKENYGKYGFDKPLVRYLRNQRKMSTIDGGVDYSYDPRTETFTGGTRGGPVTKTLKEMMADATKPKLRPKDIINMPRPPKTLMEGDVEPPFDPTITPPRPRLPNPKDGPGRPNNPFSTDTFNPIKPPITGGPKVVYDPIEAGGLPPSNPFSTDIRPPGPGGTGMGMKKGGKVKASSYKSSGNVSKASSASKRGDGIAQRGKTKGRMV
jgi:hypothetical protein